MNGENPSLGEARTILSSLFLHSNFSHHERNEPVSGNKLIIISLDAFGTADLDFALTLPNFKAFRAQAALVEQVTTVYPSLTYICHTSIITGQYPRDHGIVNNTLRQPERFSPDWYWYAQAIQAPTIFDVAKAQGYSVATILWPVTGRSRASDYNIAEIFANRKWQTQTLVSLYASSGQYLLEKNQRFGHLRNGIRQPELDDFVTAVAVDTIKEQQPDVMAIHLVDLDSTRHEHGVQSAAAQEALQRLDGHLGEIMAALAREPAYEKAHVVLLGDHYQIDTHTVIRPNHLFQAAGWLTVNRRRQITDYSVYAHAADGACYIYTTGEPISMAALEKVLTPLADYIETIYSRDEAVALGADADCFAILEAKPGYYFQSDMLRPLMESSHQQIPGGKFLRASHGYSPAKPDYTTMMMVSGPKINAQAVVPTARLIDEGPTFLALLDLAFPHQVSGQVITELLRVGHEWH